MKMTAKRAFPYQGRYLKAGDTFEVRDKTHARQLRGANFAVDAVRKGRPPKAESDVSTKSENEYQTRVLTAED